LHCDVICPQITVLGFALNGHVRIGIELQQP
jgi:hypothetical protein